MKLISHGENSAQGDVPRLTEAARALREALTKFELGRFLLENLGLNGYWTSYVLLHPDTGRVSRTSSDGAALTDLEAWILDRCPIFLATQERFRIFKRMTQALIRPAMELASIPSGLMDDLLSLDYSQAPDVRLTAVDLDEHSLENARRRFFGSQQPVQAYFEKRDGWSLDADGRWDFVTSNGLNIYVEDDIRCTELYRGIARSLRPGGHFLVSFITPPDSWKAHSEEDLARQRLLFTEVVPVKWQCARSESTTREQLRTAGFEVVAVEYDSQRMFPAVLAKKKGEGAL